MKTNFKLLKFFAFIILCGLLVAFEIPDGWTVYDKAKQYTIGIETGSGRDVKNAMSIKSKSKNCKGSCSMTQSAGLGKYAGKRIQMTGWMKSKDVTGSAYFWIRIDQSSPLKGLRFDNMRNNEVKGTTDWTKYTLIVDVPQNANSTTYGVLMKNGGQIWFDSIAFEIPPDSAKTTGIDLTIEKNNLPSEPINTDFE